MKVKITGIIMAVLLPVFAFAAMASAQTFRSGETTSVAATETIDGSVFMSGSTVDVAGKVNGDLYCAGQNVTISGTIDGDVLCGAQTITLTGTVTGDVRIGGQTIAMSGDIARNVTVAGQTVTLEGQGKVGRDAVLLGQTVTSNGQIGRDLAVGSAIATLSSTVGRNVSATVERLTLTDSAKLAGALTYTSPQKATISSGAAVAGKVSYTESKEEKQPYVATYDFGASLMWTMMLVTSAIILVLLFPRELHQTTTDAANSFPKVLLAIGVGLVASITVPVAIVFVMATILGIPFALVAMIAWILVVALSGAFTAYYIGRVVWRQNTNAVLTMLVGAGIVAILLMIPIINVLVWLLAVWYGCGAILLQLKKHANVPNYDMAKVRTRK